MSPKCQFESCENKAKRYSKSKMRKDGSIPYRKYCTKHEKVVYEKSFQYKAYKNSKCEFCGFIPIHPCQLDVDHIDGNKANNDSSNLQTLCANCHRLKTYLNKDWC